MLAEFTSNSTHKLTYWTKRK